MIANYGYLDGSGEYFISINTDCCLRCPAYDCTAACPQNVYEIIIDDYDEKVAAVKENFRKTLKYTCAACKPVGYTQVVPCIKACPFNAISHSW